MSSQRGAARGALGIIVLLAVAGVMLVGNGIAQGAPTIYTFDSCAEGWTAADDHPVVTEAWVRKAPGHESAMAFHVGPPYPVGAGNPPEDVINATLTSAAHQTSGGDVAVSYFVNHILETDFDYLYFEWSSDGTAWTVLDTFTGNSAEFPTFTRMDTVISAPAGQLFLRFRLTSDQNAAGDLLVDGEMGIDTISVPLARPVGSVCGGPSPTGSPTGSPTPEPTSTPGARHARKVTLAFKHGSLIVSGAVTVPDGFNACRSKVPVKIQRLVSGRYATVGAATTTTRGKYSKRVPDDPGRYRARATKVKKGTDICKNAMVTKQHRH